MNDKCLPTPVVFLDGHVYVGNSGEAVKGYQLCTSSSTFLVEDPMCLLVTSSSPRLVLGGV